MYEYLRRCFSRRWIAETLLITRSQLGEIDAYVERRTEGEIRAMIEREGDNQTQKSKCN